MSLSPRPWNIASSLIGLSLTVLAAVHWPVFPYFFDSTYHLAVIQGFLEAGGPVLHAFWEAAPQGRPHLYPPLFHLLFSPLVAVGLAPIALAKLWSVLSFPLLLFSAWKVTSRIASPRMACLTLVALASSFGFFLGSINYLPANAVLILSLWMMLALHHQRPLAAGLLLAMTFWLHVGLSGLLGLAVVIYGLITPGQRKLALKTFLIGLVGAAPWLLHLVQHLSLLQLQPRGEELLLENPIFLMALGAVGLGLAWRSPVKIHRFLVALLIGFLPMAWGYRFRFLATQGLFPWLLLAGLTLDWLIGQADKRSSKKWMAGALMGLLFLAPTLHRNPEQGARLAWADTTLVLLAGGPQQVTRPTAQGLFHEKFMSELSLAIEAHTTPEELIYSNIPYLAGMLTVLTGRATTNQMLREMADRTEEDQIRPAKLILWLKDPTGQRPRALQAAALKYHLRPLGETEIAYLYVNPRATGKKRAELPIVPIPLALGLVGILTAATVWDFKRKSG